MKDQISALMDGELEDGEARVLLARLREQRELGHDWHTYHLIGDTLRQTASLKEDFTIRFSARLEQEPTILSPVPPRSERASFALPVAASVAAVSLVAWAALQFTVHPDSPSAMVMASQSPPPASAAAANGGMMNVNAYLVAHQEYSPSGMGGAITYGRAPGGQRGEVK